MIKLITFLFISLSLLHVVRQVRFKLILEHSNNPAWMRVKIFDQINMIILS